MSHQRRCRGGWALLASGLLLAGCASEPAEPDITQDADFGNSVRHAIAIQTADPWSGRRPGLDGERAINTLRTYRKHVGDPKQIEQEELIKFNVGD